MATSEGPGTDVVERPRSPIPLYNGVISPDKWTTFGRMAHTFAMTDFVPKGLQGKPESIMACLVYGDSLGLHPSVALKEVYIVDGKVGVSGALMLALIRHRGHKISFVTIRDEQQQYVGTTCKGKRLSAEGEIEEEDEWTFTLEDARTAGLLPAAEKAAWTKYPETMCRWRAVAQLSRFLFADVFAGGAVYTPEEAEEAAYGDRAIRNGSPVAASSDSDEADYGDDPLLAAWLLALFASANEIEPGLWLPKKVKLALKGKTQEERSALAIELAEWIKEQGVEPPMKPTEEAPEAIDEADAEIVDDPADAA